jgi:hypothetical protein
MTGIIDIGKGMATTVKIAAELTFNSSAENPPAAFQKMQDFAKSFCQNCMKEVGNILNPKTVAQPEKRKSEDVLGDIFKSFDKIKDLLKEYRTAKEGNGPEKADQDMSKQSMAKIRGELGEEVNNLQKLMKELFGDEDEATTQKSKQDSPMFTFTQNKNLMEQLSFNPLRT